MQRREKLYLGGLLLIAAVFRLGLLFASWHIPAIRSLIDVGDAIGYNQLAHNLLCCGKYAFEGGGPTAFRMPGYPLFLAAIYSLWDAEVAVQLAQIVLSILTVAITYQLARDVSSDLWVPALTGLIVALHPLLAIVSLALITETVVTFLLVFATWQVIRLTSKNNLQPTLKVFSALLPATIAIYFREATLLAYVGITGLFCLFCLCAKKVKGAIRIVGFSILLLAITLFPWWVRNYVVMGDLVLLTTSTGTNLYIGNNPGADGGDYSDYPYVLPNMTEIQSSSFLTYTALDWIRSNPRRFLILLIKKAARHWSLIAHTKAGPSPLPTSAKMLALALALVLYSNVFVGCMKLNHLGKQRDLLTLSLVPIALFIPSLISHGGTRYALPSFPEIAILAALGVMHLKEWLTERFRLSPRP